MQFFSNKKKVTIQSLQKMFLGKKWSHYPAINGQLATYWQLYRECQQPDDYKDYEMNYQKLQKEFKKYDRAVREIESLKTQIIVKNSEEQYNSKLKQMRDKKWQYESKMNTLKHNKPKSKSDLLNPIKVQIDKAIKAADNELIERMKQNKNSCHCRNSDYCQC